MWSWLSDIWDGVSNYAGEAYDYVADSYVGQGIEKAYDYVAGNESYGTFKDSDFDNFNYSNYSGVLGTALEFGQGFLDIAAAPSKGGMPPSSRRRVSAPGSTAGGANFKAGKSNMASLEFGYVPRVGDAIIKANASKVPSIEMAIAQMMNYKGSGGATIKLQGAKPPSVAARTKSPSFAPKYYG